MAACLRFLNHRSRPASFDFGFGWLVIDDPFWRAGEEVLGFFQGCVFDLDELLITLTTSTLFFQGDFQVRNAIAEGERLILFGSHKRFLIVSLAEEVSDDEEEDCDGCNVEQLHD